MPTFMELLEKYSKNPGKITSERKYLKVVDAKVNLDNLRCKIVKNN